MNEGKRKFREKLEFFSPQKTRPTSKFIFVTIIWTIWNQKNDKHFEIIIIIIDEAIEFLSTHNWVHELNLGHVDFKVKSKQVIDSFLFNRRDVT